MSLLIKFCILYEGYVSSAFPFLLHIAYKYGDEDSPGALAPSSGPFERTLLASTNAGGENVARGSLLGALVGAKYGLQGIPPGDRQAFLWRRMGGGYSRAGVEVGKKGRGGDPPSLLWRTGIRPITSLF